MTTRLTPYRKKPSEKWSELRAALDSQTLYVVQRLGPAGFSVRDDSGEVYRVILGNPHSCTCADSRSDNECIHIVFCVLKAIRVPPEHPLAWQTSYTDNEVDQALDASSKAVRRRPTAARRPVASAQGSGGTEKSSDDAAAATKAVRQPLEGDENYCPICQDQMLLTQALTWCRNGCGNNIHGKCMKNFAQFRIESRKEVSCPLCREPWVSMAELNNDCKRAGAVRFSCAKVSCNTCTSQLTSDFYRCVECTLIPQSSATATSTSTEKKPPASLSAVDFCKDCFCRIGRAHNSHHFLTTTGKALYQEFEWKSAANPRTAAMSRFTPEFLQAIQARELSNADYDILLQLDDQRMQLPSFYETILKSLNRPHTQVMVNTAMKPCPWCTSNINVSTSEIDVCFLPCCNIPAHSECLRSALKACLRLSDATSTSEVVDNADDIAPGSGCLLDNFTCMNTLCQSAVLKRLTRMKVKKVRASTADASTTSSISDASGVPLTGFSVSGVNLLRGPLVSATAEPETRSGPGLGLRQGIRAAISGRLPPRRPASQSSAAAGPVDAHSLFVGAAPPSSNPEQSISRFSESQMVTRHLSPMSGNTSATGRNQGSIVRGPRLRSQSAISASSNEGDVGGDPLGASIISGHGIGVSATVSGSELINTFPEERINPAASASTGGDDARRRGNRIDAKASNSLIRHASPIRTNNELITGSDLQISSRRLADVGSATSSSSSSGVTHLANAARTRGNNSLVETRRKLAQSSSRDRVSAGRPLTLTAGDGTALDLRINPL